MEPPIRLSATMTAITANSTVRSEERAAVVAQYFREVKDIPMRRILVPVGYGATHPAVSNDDRYNRELNRQIGRKGRSRRTVLPGSEGHSDAAHSRARRLWSHPSGCQQR